MKKLSTQQASQVETLFSPSTLKKKLEELVPGEAYLAPKKTWKYKTPPRQLVYELMGAGKFSVETTKDKKSWLITKL